MRQDAAEADRVDFSGLKRHRDAPAKAVEGLRRDFEARVVELRGEIEAMQPNMKVGGRDAAERDGGGCGRRNWVTAVCPPPRKAAFFL